MQQPAESTLTTIIRRHQAALQLAQVTQVSATVLGQGEANLNMLVRVNQAQHFNVRIGLRGPESARTLQQEQAALQLVPPGIGPRAYVVDVSGRDLAQPYSILEYLPGVIKAAWSDADLLLHAHTLAQLHQRTFNQHGDLAQPSDSALDMLQRFDAAVRYWATREPAILALPHNQRLLPTLRDFIATHNQLFTSLRSFTLVHGDLHKLNIVFSGAHIRYIDWESAQIGDPALDLAMIGWDVATAWQMELSSQRRERFLHAYLQQRADPTLITRRDVWMVYTMFFDQIYHRTQIASDTSGRQAHTVQQIERYLRARFAI